MASRRMPWCKLSDELFTSPSHAELDGDALLVLIVLMTFVRASVDVHGWQPWALLPSGKPISAVAIATKARKPVAIVERALAALVDAGTVDRRDDGALGLPGFERHQRGESTERAAESRARQAADLPIRLTTEPTPEQRRVHIEVDRVRQALTYGWEGHTPPPRPRGLPALRLYKGVTTLIESGWDAEVLLDAVAKVAELVEAGELPKADWTSTKVFSGWIDTMLVRHAEWQDARARRAKAMSPEPTEASAPVVGAEHVEQETRALMERLRGGVRA